jgi:hypothetical protein
MKYPVMFVIGALFLTAFPICVASQDSAVDLAVTDLECYCLPGGGFMLEARVVLATMPPGGPTLAPDSVAAILTSVQFYLDGMPVDAVQYDVTVGPSGDCTGMPPDCSGYCPPLQISGEWIVAECGPWTLRYFDPILQEWVVSDVCSCTYPILMVGNSNVSTHPTTATATVDPDNLVPEMDETNNSMTIVVGPSANDATSWGLIKALYR